MTPTASKACSTEACTFTTRAGAAAVLCTTPGDIDDAGGTVALASATQVAATETHVPRLTSDPARGLWTARRIDQSHGHVGVAGAGNQLIVGRVACALRRLGDAFGGHLVSDAAVCGIDQEQRRLRVVDRHDGAAVGGDRDAGERARRLDFAE